MCLSLQTAIPFFYCFCCMGMILAPRYNRRLLEECTCCKVTSIKTTIWMLNYDHWTSMKCLPYVIWNMQGCARGLFSRDQGETETLKPETEAETEALTIQAEARPRPRSSELETETRLRRSNSEARLSRGTTAPRDGLETKASRPRPHPLSTSFQGLM